VNKGNKEHVEAHTITCTNPESKSVTILHRYVCQIHSRRHIELRALERGYLKAVTIKEGQAVKEGDVMFQVAPVLYQKKADAEMAEAKLADLKYKNTKQLYEDNVVSQNEVLLLQAKKDEAQANADLAKAELNFATVKAPFDGIVDRLHCQQGSLVEEGEILSTLSDNSVMWVYFNVPEASYLEYMPHMKELQEGLKIELVLANGEKFDQLGKLAAIEADFNNSNGNIPFRADFPNPNRLLRNGQTGTVVISRVRHDAIVIPQRATFEVLQQRYVYVIDKDGVAHQREIAYEEVEGLDDLFIIKSGVGVQDEIVLEGVRQIHDGDKVECKYRQPEKVVPKLKYRAE
jgi:membrane fusion protein, multidrug efflux system